MPLPLWLIAGYAAGTGIALAARPGLTTLPASAHGRYLMATVLYSSLVLTPIALLLHFTFPDWHLMYLANPAHISAFVMIPLLIVLVVLAPALGFLLGARLVLSDQLAGVRAALGGAAILALIIVLAGWDRVSQVAYYESFHYGGQQIPVSSSSLLIALLAALPAAAGAFALVFLTVRRHARA